MKNPTAIIARWLDVARTFGRQDASVMSITPALDSYTVAIPAELIEQQPELIGQIIAFALDTLDVHHLDMRICADC
jgi:hypothetical protein